MVFDIEQILTLVLRRKLTYEQTVDLWRREIVLLAIKANEGHFGSASEMLGIHRNSIRNILQRGREAQLIVQKETRKEQK